MSLPTFKEAMDGLDWNWKIGASLVGPYLDGSSLAACCAVSKDFSKHFLPVLWSNPLKITKAKQRPFLKTVMFMHSARGASRELRSFVRTFDLGRFYRDVRTAVAEQCDETFDDSWFMSRSQLFPALQFAIMDKAPHAYFPPSESSWPSKSMLRHYKRQHKAAERRRTSSSNESDSSSITSDEQRNHVWLDKMRPLLFSACGCQESAGSSLVRDLYTSNLMYLDLSYTKIHPLFKNILPSAEIGFPNLRVLKLRGLRITDSEFSRLTQINNGKLWSLDLTDNVLTDATVQELVSSRFMLDNIPPKPTSIILPDQDMFEVVPDYQRDAQGERFESTAPLRPDNADKFMKYIENHSSFPSIYEQFLDAQSPLLRQTGLTHLYLSRNRLTSLGVKALLSLTNRLQVFDVGSVEGLNEDGSRPNYASYTTAYQQLNSNSVSSVSRGTRSRMEVLRIHHSFVTHVPTIISEGSQNKFTLELLNVAENSVPLARLSGVRRNMEHMAFSPMQNYRITKLTLTDIPTKSCGLTIERLIEFLEECRIQEERLNEARKYTEKSRRTPQLLPGLRTLRLEFIPEDTSPQSPNRGGSVSGDRDADNFLASSEGDFSFFDDPNTMSSVSRRGSVATTIGGTSGPATPASRKGSIMGGGVLKRTISTLSRPGSSGSGAAAPKEPPAYAAEVKDVVEELKKYRARKEGKWTGDLQLVFPHGR